MKDKTVLITGANQGIGKATAAALGKLGARVVLVCRNAEKARVAIADIERAGASNVELILGDMASQADIRRVATEFKAKHDRLDVLINNAGILVPKLQTTVDGLEETFAVNHLGYFLLTQSLLDVLRAGPSARVVNVSSEVHRRAKMQWDDLQYKTTPFSTFGAYGQSKLANVLFTRELARRLEGTRVTANSLHPGVIASGFGHTYGGFFSVVLKVVRPFLSTPEEGARTSVYLASSPDVQGVSGKYFEKSKEREPGPAALEGAAPARLWAISEELTSLRGKAEAAA
jgi:NAD(P)-dependent dehydrogenase (short-subunit alcohol dehydrogenase family)